MASASSSATAADSASARSHPAHRGSLHDIVTIARYELRALLLSARTWAPMLIYAGFAALALYGYVAAAERARSAAIDKFGPAATKALDDQKTQEQMTGSALVNFGWGTEDDAKAIFAAQTPLMLIYFFVIASYFLPLLVAIVTFDQFSELSTRGARYALLRVGRSGYFAGKALAAFGTVAVFLLLMWAVAVGTAIHHEGMDSLGPAVREGVRGWLLMCLLALPYLSITAFVSSWVTPGYAFVLTLGSLIGLAIGHGLVDHLFPYLLMKAGWPSGGELERHLLAFFPWHHAPKLIARSHEVLASGAAGLLGLAAIGYLLTLFNVRRRDV